MSEEKLDEVLGELAIIRAGTLDHFNKILELLTAVRSTDVITLYNKLSSIQVELQELRLAFHQKFGTYTPSAMLTSEDEEK